MRQRDDPPPFRAGPIALIFGPPARAGYGDKWPS